MYIVRFITNYIGDIIYVHNYVPNPDTNINMVCILYCTYMLIQ